MSFKMSIVEKLNSQIEQLFDLSFEWTNLRCLTFHFFRIGSIIESCCSIFPLYELVQSAPSNWFFQKNLSHNFSMFCDIFSHENNWHVFSKYLFQKNWTHKLSNYVTYLLNEQIQDVFTIHFFWEQAWSQIEMLINYFSLLTDSVSVCSFKLNFS